MKSTQFSFGSGEISPEMQGRIDAVQYRNGAALCRNFLTRPQGMVERRPGMQFCGEAYDQATASRLIPFSFNDEQSYAVELSHLRGRIWQDGKLIKHAQPAGDKVEGVSNVALNRIRTEQAHGLQAGDTIRVLGDPSLFVSAAAADNAYEVQEVPDAHEFRILAALQAPSGSQFVYKVSDLPAEYNGGAGAVVDAAASNAIPNFIQTTTSHGFVDGQSVQLRRTVGESAFPSGVYSGVTYYVVNSNTNQLQLSLRRGGQPVEFADTFATSPVEYRVTRYYSKGDALFADGTVAGGLEHGIHVAKLSHLGLTSDPVPANFEKESDDGTLTFDHPFTRDQVGQVRHVQSNDVMTLVHPSHTPQELTRWAQSTWNVLPIQFVSTAESPTGLTAVPDRGLTFKLSRERKMTGNLQITVDFPQAGTAVVIPRTEHVCGYGLYNAQSLLGLNAAGVANNPQVGPFVAAGSPLDNISSGVAVGDMVFIEWVVGTSKHFNSSADNGYFIIGHVEEQEPAETTYITLQTREGGNYLLKMDTDDDSSSPFQLNLYVSPANADTQQFYKVTSVDQFGHESSPRPEVFADNVIEGINAKNTLTWDEMPNAVRYRVYRKLNNLFGLIGESTTTTFVDEDRPIDFSRTPPIQDDSLDGRLGFPRAVSYFEQRRLFAGLSSAPRTLLMTNSGTETGLSFSLPIKDTNRISVTMASRQAAVIQHIVPLGDLLIFTQQGEWRLFTINSDAVGPETVAVRQQSEIGANFVTPVVVNNQVLYVAERGNHVYMIGYDGARRGFSTEDISIRAQHLFDGLSITDAAQIKSPFSVSYFVSSAGKLVACTLVPSEQVLAWHQHDSLSTTFDSVCSVPEGTNDTLYLSVTRNGTRYIERMVADVNVSRLTSVFVDGAVSRDNYSTTYTKGAALTIKPQAALSEGNLVNITSDEDVFTSSHVGRRLRIRIGTADCDVDVTSFTDARTIAAHIVTELPASVLSQAATTWAFTDVEAAGLGHLEGQTVQIVADGVYAGTKTVSGGVVTLPSATGRWVVGVGYDSQLQTLPQAYEIAGFGKGTTKNVRDVWLRLIESSGLQVGPSSSELVPVSALSTTSLASGEFETSVPASWTQDGQMLIQQSDPLPASISSLTMLTEMGD